MDGLLLDEFAFVQESVPIRYMNWKRRPQNDERTGFVRLYVPESKANTFPSRLCVCSEAVSIRRIRKRQQIVHIQIAGKREFLRATGQQLISPTPTPSPNITNVTENDYHSSLVRKHKYRRVAIMPVVGRIRFTPVNK
ncbi:hypothetical protein EPUL_006398 [Erysiphe pulchra]|uniref:Uncharacterized protein n=1 Tax=Erysiphe pulchra TaxID=225359 RepID=A0A2S4PMM2_9PEZI|nr:hypothetical protein EPUL_006398 [Erysiphe pulchra]